MSNIFCTAYLLARSIAAYSSCRRRVSYRCWPYIALEDEDEVADLAPPLGHDHDHVIFQLQHKLRLAGLLGAVVAPPIHR